MIDPGRGNSHWPGARGQKRLELRSDYQPFSETAGSGFADTSPRMVSVWPPSLQSPPPPNPNQSNWINVVIIQLCYQ